jgi:hypothetical protein
LLTWFTVSIEFIQAGKRMKYATPTGFNECTVTALATMCYTAGVHCDKGDLSYTVGIHAFGEHEPREVYQFIYLSLRLLGSPPDHHGIIMTQPTGTLTLCPASEISHGGSVDVHLDGVISKEGWPVCLALMQTKATFTFCKRTRLESVIELSSIAAYYVLSCHRADHKTRVQADPTSLSLLCSSL